MLDWQTIIALISVVVAGASWATSARKGRVDNLCKIIDAQAQRIEELEEDLASANRRWRAAEARITELESENNHYREILCDEGIDPDGHWEDS
jgi:chromosome segregation ATPase